MGLHIKYPIWTVVPFPHQIRKYKIAYLQTDNLSLKGEKQDMGYLFE
jgi:hypothetical protein